MRRRISLSVILVVGFLVALGTAPAMLAKQGGDAGNWSDIVVTCGPENQACNEIERGRYQSYRVDLLPSAFFPEITYNESMVVRVISGTLAFRATSPDVVVESAPGSNGIPILSTSPVTLPIGTAPDPAALPTYTNTGDTLEQLDKCSQPPHSRVCLLNP